MNQISKLYIFLYFFYSYFGYNIINRISIKKSIDYALFDRRAYAFIGKRLCMLSHIIFIYSSFFLEYPNNDRYINTLSLHIIVNIGYFTIWGISEKSTFAMHIFWSFPVIIYKNIYYKNIYFDLYNYNFNYENILLINFLLLYSHNYKYIYTPRIKFIDKD